MAYKKKTFYKDLTGVVFSDSSADVYGRTEKYVKYVDGRRRRMVRVELLF